jgi:integrase
MKAATSFVISEFTNPSGDIVFRVSGWLDGKRLRKNFPTRHEAEAERQLLEIQKYQGEGSIRTAVTRLTDDQLHDAEAAFRRLGNDARSLFFYVDYGLANYREPARQQPLADAVTAYVAVKTHQKEQKIISAPQLTTIKRNLEVLKKHFPDATVADLTAKRLTAHFQHGNACPKTYNNRRGVLSTFLKFAFQQDWILTNPIEKVAYHRIAHRRGSAQTLSAMQAQELMAYVEQYRGGSLVPYFALCLFAGIRPCLRTGEILKLRPGHVQLDTGVIHIEPEVSKVSMKRNVTIQPNLAAWLRTYPLDRCPIIVPALQKHRAKIAKLFGLSHDIMRHTFISMFVGKFRSMGEAALQAGNSETIIRKHYLDLKTAAEAEQFFGILPQRVHDSTLPFAVLHAAA